MKKIILGVLFLVLLSANVYAHKISVFAYLEGNAIKGEVYFNDGSPAKGTRVTLCPVGEEKILAETKTNQEGSFELPLPKGLSQVKIIAWAEMGHRAEMKLSLKGTTEEPPSQETVSTQPQTPQAIPASTINEAELRKIVREEVKKEISPFYRMLNELARKLDKPSLAEIFGGIGYIFGLFGLWALLQARKNK